MENPLVTKVTADVMNVTRREEFSLQCKRRAVTPFLDNNLSKLHGCTCEFL